MSTPSIPNYRVIRLLGEGAFSQVWLGEHLRNRRLAAIKVLKSSSILSSKDAERLFLREGEVLAGFRERNIVAIYDNDTFDGVHYLAMEYLPAGTLAERAKAKALQAGEAIAIIVQILSALAATHRAGIIHRDLKPANIMLRDETTPVITDFGTVRVIGDSSIYSKEGLIVGTPTYMSPEQISGHALDGRSDLYSLGIMFFELLTGSPPFKGNTIQEIATQHLAAPIPLLPPDLSALQSIIERMLAKNPDDRPKNADVVIGEIRSNFLSEVSLRKAVGSLGSEAWSAQLRALGFVLSEEDAQEVRRLELAFKTQLIPKAADNQGHTPNSESRDRTEVFKRAWMDAAATSQIGKKRTPGYAKWFILGASVLAITGWWAMSPAAKREVCVATRTSLIELGMPGAAKMLLCTQL